MKRALIGVIAVLLLTGCASAEPSPTTEPPKSENPASCRAFNAATDDIKLAIVYGPVNNDGKIDQAAFDTAFDKIDTAALKADGDVKSRLSELVAQFADSPGDIWIDGTEYFAALEDIQRACEVSGTKISPATW